jgi:hypothetical protein
MSAAICLISNFVTFSSYNGAEVSFFEKIDFVKDFLTEYYLNG